MSPSMSPASKFRVVVVGGGVAGLTLVNSLQLANIDYVLLESRLVIDPQVGASIGILPNGARILDQVGCWDELIESTTPLLRQINHKADGGLLGEAADGPVLGQARSAYATCFLDRQLLLGILAKNVRDQDRIKLNKKVVRVEQEADRASVICEDGTEYEGDVVIGADGIYSVVRREMWRHADGSGEGNMFEKDKTAMKAEYQCLFGISNPIPNLLQGDWDVTFAKDVSTLSIVGKGGRVFWFLFSALDKTYYYPNIPRYTQADKEKLISRFGHIAIKENSQVTVRDLYDAHIVAALVALEEAEFQQWRWGRLVCVGDSAHKMTPNLGAGGNSAIESCAALSNRLYDLAKDSESRNPSLASIRAALQAYQEKRRLRITATMQVANGLTRLHALKTRVHSAIAYGFVPIAGDFLYDMFGDMVVGAELLEYVPPPPRSLEGLMPFNPKQGWGFTESKAARALWATPFLILMYLATQVWVPDVGPRMDSDAAGHTPWNRVIPLVDITTVYAIWLIEGNRRSNRATPMMLPSIFGLLLQKATAGFIASLYFFLFYIFSPIASFKAIDMRLTDLSYIHTILPTLAVFSILPIYLMWSHSVENTRVSLIWLWQVFPILGGLVQFMLAGTAIRRTILHDRIHAPKRDVATVRATASAMGFLSAVVWISGLLSQKSSLAGTLVSSQSSPNQGFLGPLLQHALQNDYFLFSAASTLWLMYAFGDLKRAGMLEMSWFIITTLGMIVIVCFGPGSAFVAGWLLREHCLINRRHEAAVIAAEPHKTPRDRSANGSAGASARNPVDELKTSEKY